MTPGPVRGILVGLAAALTVAAAQLPAWTPAAETIPAPAAEPAPAADPSLANVCRRTTVLPGGTGTVGEQVVPHIPPGQYDEPPGPDALYFICEASQ